MKFWFVCLLIVFGVAELCQWLQGLTLPMPFYGAAGLLLAFLSNSNQWLPRLSEGNHGESEALLASTESAIATGEEAENAILPPVLHAPQAATQSKPQLPNLPVAAPPPISFTIQKP